MLYMEKNVVSLYCRAFCVLLILNSANKNRCIKNSRSYVNHLLDAAVSIYPISDGIISETFYCDSGYFNY